VYDNRAPGKQVDEFRAPDVADHETGSLIGVGDRVDPRDGYA
jgi:hypothetical protein